MLLRDSHGQLTIPGQDKQLMADVTVVLDTFPERQSCSIDYALRTACRVTRTAPCQGEHRESVKVAGWRYRIKGRSIWR